MPCPSDCDALIRINRAGWRQQDEFQGRAASRWSRSPSQWATPSRRRRTASATGFWSARRTWSGKELRAVKTPRHDRVAAPRFHLVGESFGGTVTLYTSVVQGARLLSATCISAPHRGGSIKVLKGWNTLLGTADGMRAWSQNMMEYRFRDGAVSPAGFAWFKAEQDKTDPAMVRGVSELVMKTDLTPFLVRVLGPVLLLAPDSSPFVESQLVAELHGLLTTSELQVFAGTRHGLAFSHARECAELFVEFTIRNGRRPAGAQ